ncbi:hypothetical protein, partial [Enterococcus faecium]|uniref:hypothetical protein n=1 Tax=Enterococcus faecium TaxID=1352 RepID=UPI001A91EC2C
EELIHLISNYSKISLYQHHLTKSQKTSKVEKEFYLRCSYLTLSVLFDKEPKKLSFRDNPRS